MNKRFHRKYPKHYYYEKDGVYIFCTDDHIDTTFPVNPDVRRINSDNIEQAVREHEAKVQYIINLHNYVRTYDLYKWTNELQYDLDMLANSIVSPMRPVVPEDEITKEHLMGLLRKLKELEQVIEEHIDEF